jgi:hypothetical protein
MMLDEGKKTFRYETFGSEAFWGDTLRLHKAIVGEKFVGENGQRQTLYYFSVNVDNDTLFRRPYLCP